MSTLPERLRRTEALVGKDAVEALTNTSVILFGVGGVGSWCAEALARTGIGTITLVDPDTVAESNINRQLPALTDTLHMPKAKVMTQRIALINPDCHALACVGRYTAGNAATFGIEDYDYAIDAIDSLADKADLILRCTGTDTAPTHGFYSSMGAARKADSSQVRMADFWKAEGCPLARALRTRFRRAGLHPHFKCVYSPEQPLPKSDASVNGTFAHITATFGLRLAEAVVRDVCRL